MQESLQNTAKQIRIDIIKSLNKAQSGHTGGSLGMADVFTAIYFKVMKNDPKNPWDPDRDRMILSNGHIAPVWYATLANRGYFPRDELMSLRKLNSRLQGHPHYRSAPGVENSAGPLGQGISVAVGHALAARLDNKDYFTYCSLGDGELNEGEVWEALLSINKFKLNNLICFVDRNKIQLSGTSDDIMPLEPLADKFASFAMNVIEAEGHDMDEIISAFDAAKVSKKPSIIIFHTIMGKGVSFMENTYKWHGVAPTDDEMARALKELNCYG